MKVVRITFLSVLVGVLLLMMFLVLHIPAATKASSTQAASPVSATIIKEKIVNADGGVYWRSDPAWNTPITLVRQGVYTGDTVKLACYQRGSTVPPYYNNPLWYWAEIVSGYGQGSGWVNDHFLNTGTNQPNLPVDGVIRCPTEPYVWSNSGIAYVRAQPGDSMFYEPVLYNNYPLALSCWVDGGWMEGDYWTNRWFYLPVPDDNTGTWGYINASVVANRHTLPGCDSLFSPTPSPVPTSPSSPIPTPSPVPTPTPTPELPTPTTGPGQITHMEQEGHHGANTFTNPYNASGMGQKIPAATWVQVTCKVYAPEIQSVNPDGYWYRIASSPWNNAYYAPANTFMNGDPWNGPYTHNTDFNVPNC